MTEQLGQPPVEEEEERPVGALPPGEKLPAPDFNPDNVTPLMQQVADKSAAAADNQKRMYHMARRYAGETDPDTTARALKLSKEYDLPPEYTAKHVDLLEKYHQDPSVDVNKMVANSPEVVKYVTEKPENSAIMTNQDVAKMGLLEWLIHGGVVGGLRSGAATVELGTLGTLHEEGLIDISPETIEELQKIAGATYGERDSEGLHFSDLNPFDFQAGVYTAGFAGRAATQLKRFTHGAFKMMPYMGAGSAAYMAGAAAGAGIAQITPGMPIDDAVAAKVGGTLAAIGVLGQIERGNLAVEMRRMRSETGTGFSDEQIYYGSHIGGILSGVLEYVPLGKGAQVLTGRDLKKAAIRRATGKVMGRALRRPSYNQSVRQFGKHFASMQATEIPTEIAQDLTQLLVIEASKWSDPAKWEYMTAEQVYEQMLETALLTWESTMGLGMMGGVSRLGIIAPLDLHHQKVRAEAVKARILLYSDTVEGTDIRARYPQKEREVLERVVKKEGTKNVYMTVDGFKRAVDRLNEQAGEGAVPVTYEETATAIWGNADQFKKAESLGGESDLIFKLDTWLSKVSGTELEMRSLNEIRLQPEDLSGHEIEQADKQLAQLAKEGKARDLETFTPEERMLYDEMYDKMSRQYGIPQYADAVAKVHAHVMSTQAGKVGVAADALASQYTMHVRSLERGGLVTAAGRSVHEVNSGNQTFMEALVAGEPGAVRKAAKEMLAHVPTPERTRPTYKGVVLVPVGDQNLALTREVAKGVGGARVAVVLPEIDTLNQLREQLAAVEEQAAEEGLSVDRKGELTRRMVSLGAEITAIKNAIEVETTDPEKFGKGRPGTALRPENAIAPSELKNDQVILIDGVRGAGHRISALQEQLPGARYLAYGQDSPQSPLPEADTETPDQIFDRLTQQRISARRPTAIKATENPLEDDLHIDAEVARRDPEAHAANVAILALAPMYRPSSRAQTTEQQYRRWLKVAAGNLMWLYDMMAPEDRARGRNWYAGANVLARRWARRFGVPVEATAGALAALSPQLDWFANVTLAERLLDTMTNKLDHQLDPEMTATIKEIYAKKRYDTIRGNLTEGVTLRDLLLDENLVLAAAWIRAYDQTHNDRTYRGMTPEGGFIGKVKTGLGEDVTAGWAHSLAGIAKAVAIVAHPVNETIDKYLGDQHKIRSFFNNILHPENDTDVTIDTHAVAAVNLLPVAGSSPETAHNFGARPSPKLRQEMKGTPAEELAEQSPVNSSISGLQGTYVYIAEAHREAARQIRARDGVELLPRELQSIVWEQVRVLFPSGWKNPQRLDEARTIWYNYRNGRISLDAARTQLSDLSGTKEGRPSWAGSPGGLHEGAPDSSYQEGLRRPGPREEADGTDGRGGVDATSTVPEEFTHNQRNLLDPFDSPIDSAPAYVRHIVKQMPMYGTWRKYAERMADRLKKRSWATPEYQAAVDRYWGGGGTLAAYLTWLKNRLGEDRARAAFKVAFEGLEDGMRDSFRDLYERATLDDEIALLTEKWEAQGVEVTITQSVAEHKQDVVELANLQVTDRGERKKGLGTAFMEEFTEIADRHGVRIELQVAEQNFETGTTSRTRLVKFYKRFGFVENKGKHKRFDYSLYAEMYREPSPVDPDQLTLPDPRDAAERRVSYEDQDARDIMDRWIVAAIPVSSKFPWEARAPGDERLHRFKSKEEAYANLIRYVTPGMLTNRRVFREAEEGREKPMTTEELIRGMAKASTISWKTKAAFNMGKARFVRQGFASIPSIAVTVISPATTGDLVPIVRQVVYRQLEQALGNVKGIEGTTPSDWLATSPVVGTRSRKRKFEDQNPDSPTNGKNKMGQVHEFWFEITDTGKAAAIQEAMGGYRTSYQRALHGSGKRGIMQFDNRFIGTGEGFAAFGWGMYFADKRGVAENYRKARIKEHGEVEVSIKGLSDAESREIVGILWEEAERLGLDMDEDIAAWNELLQDYADGLKEEVSGYKDAIRRMKQKNLSPNDAFEAGWNIVVDEREEGEERTWGEPWYETRAEAEAALGEIKEDGIESAYVTMRQMLGAGGKSDKYIIVSDEESYQIEVGFSNRQDADDYLEAEVGIPGARVEFGSYWRSLRQDIPINKNSQGKFLLSLPQYSSLSEAGLQKYETTEYDTLRDAEAARNAVLGKLHKANIEWLALNIEERAERATLAASILKDDRLEVTVTGGIQVEVDGKPLEKTTYFLRLNEALRETLKMTRKEQDSELELFLADAPNRSVAQIQYASFVARARLEDLIERAIDHEEVMAVGDTSRVVSHMRDEIAALEHFDDTVDVDTLSIGGIGQVYEVEIPNDDQLASWDLTIAEQPQAVQDAIAAIEAQEPDVLEAKASTEIRRMNPEFADLADAVIAIYGRSLAEKWDDRKTIRHLLAEAKKHGADYTRDSPGIDGFISLTRPDPLQEALGWAAEQRKGRKKPDKSRLEDWRVVIGFSSVKGRVTLSRGTSTGDRQADIRSGLATTFRTFQTIVTKETMTFEQTYREIVRFLDDRVSAKKEAKALRAWALKQVKGINQYEDGRQYQGHSDMLVSYVLRSLGVPGHRFLDGTSRKKGRGSHNYVIYDDSTIQIKRELYSRDDEVKGRMRHHKRGRDYLFEFARAKDVTTGFHELSHFYLEMLGDIYESGVSTAQQQKDYETTIAWLDKKTPAQLPDGTERKTIETRDDLFEVQDEFAKQGREEDGPLEIWARAWVTYLYEGKSPTQELRPLFDTIKAWLKETYSKLQRVVLNKEIREVFDRLIASDKEIDHARALLKVEPMQALREHMTPEAWEDSISRFKLSREADQARLRAIMLDDERQKISDEYQRDEERYRAEVEEEMAGVPIMALLRFLTHGELHGMETLPDLYTDQWGTPWTLSKNALVEEYGKGILAELPSRQTTKNDKDPYLYREDEVVSIHPKVTRPRATADQLAGLFGFTSGDAMINALKTAPRYDEVIQSEVQRRLDGKYGNLLEDQDALLQEALAAAQGPEAVEAILGELRNVRRLLDPSARQTRRLVDAKTMWARAQLEIMQTPVGEISPGQYQRQAEKHGRAAFDASEAGDMALAWDHRLRQAWNLALYRAARDGERKARSATKYLKSAAKAGPIRERAAKADRIDIAEAEGEASALDPGSARQGGGFVAMIDAYLATYNFKAKTKKHMKNIRYLREWVAQREAEGLEPMVDPDVLIEIGERNVQEVPLEELLTLRDAIKNVDWMSKKMIGEGERAFANQKQLMLRALEENMEVVYDITDDPAMRRRTRAQRFAQDTSSLWSDLKRMEELFRRADGGDPMGPWAQGLWNPAVDAQNEENDMLEQFTKQVRELLENLPRKQRTEMYTKMVEIPGFTNEAGQPISRTRQFLIAVALNTGNAWNKKVLISAEREGFPDWGAESVEAILKLLTKEEWAVVQGIWDILEGMWPRIQEQSRRMKGIAPPHIKPVPFVRNVDGEEIHMRGGYVPLMYDHELRGEVQEHLEGRLFQQGANRGQTQHSWDKERVKGVRYPILLDMTVFLGHLQQVAHDLSHRERLIQMYRLVTDKEIYIAMQRYFGRADAAQIRKWVQRLARDRSKQMEGEGAWQRVFKAFRTNLTMAAMAFKITIPAQNIVNFANIIEPTVGADPRDVIAATREFYFNWRAQSKRVNELSGEMRHRFNTLDREIREAQVELMGQYGALAQAKRFGFAMVVWTDKLTAYPLWIAAYNQALRGDVKGQDGKVMVQPDNEEAAIRWADRAVRTTLTAGGVKDIAAVQDSKDEAVKAATTFYSWMSMILMRHMALGYDVKLAAREKRLMRMLPYILARWTCFFLIGATLAEMMADRGPEDDEEWYRWALGKMAAYALGSVPVARDLPIDRWIRGQPTGRNVSRTAPLGGAVDDLWGMVRVLGRQIKDEEAEPVEIGLAALEAAGTAKGLPGTSQVAIAVRYWADVLEGREDPAHFLEFMRRSAFRPKSKAGKAKKKSRSGGYSP